MVLTRSQTQTLLLRKGFDAFKTNVSGYEDMDLEDVHVLMERLKVIQRLNIYATSQQVRYATMRVVCRLMPMLLGQLLHHPSLYNKYSRARIAFINMCDRVLAENELNNAPNPCNIMRRIVEYAKLHPHQ